MNKSIKLTENRTLGRYAIVTDNVSAGEILFEEYPFVVGPKSNSKLICLVCCRPIDTDGLRCPKCKWPLCEKCVDEQIHRLECEIFVNNSVKFYGAYGSENEVCLQLDCITPLRFLLLIESNPDRWNTEIQLMEHHEIARRNSVQWNVDENNIVGYLHGPCGLKKRFSADMIQRICGIIEVNSFEARTKSGHEIRCVFPKTAVMSHSCVPNTCHSILASDGYKIFVRASVNIEKDTPLTACYTFTMSGTLARQEHLRKGKYFTCQCARCIDPTELGTHFSSIKCKKCDDGYVVSTDPLDESASWKCMVCMNIISSSATSQTLSAIQNEANGVEITLFTPEGIGKCEYLLKKLKHKLHPNHFIQIDLRQNLIKMLGRTPGYQLNELSDIQLKYKIDLCYQILSLLHVLHPGQTRVRAMLLYELHAPLFLHGKIAFRKGLINDTELKEILTKSIDLLDECITILQREDVSSIENKVVYVAANTLKYLQEAAKNNFY
ncbi:SET domain-containing protein SmydA-8, isoform A [Pseudolycoriella hygida]|uniref:SET domain-containing protein SmydA-8, isoform A n=1 Tax=Pseudolycoriella hygida TaxID=35572 RepID=A0A9Q0MZT3_9DIPT|nr:SET domain-containing protein SmydA-8, isoform A [Pseudolycoriella hygida]